MRDDGLLEPDSPHGIWKLKKSFKKK